MASAFQCDRCGGYYDRSTSYYKYNLSKYSETGKYHSFDLCNSCKDSLEEWMNRMLFRQTEQNREEKDNAD